MKLHRSRTRGCWWALVDSPLLLSAWGGIALLCLTILQVSGALGRAEQLRAVATSALARVAAETAAIHHLRDGASDRATVRIGEAEVAIRKRGGDWLLTCATGGRRFDFRATELTGAAPLAFAHPCSVVDTGIVPRFDTVHRLALGDQPRLDEVALEGAVRADHLMVLRRDRGVALLTWETGTERDDFVFDTQRPAAELGKSGDLVVVPGHLWIEVADGPLRLNLQKDLVLVVRGNLYVGRSIHVDGPGRLVLVAGNEPDSAVFADADGNGRWSVGDALRRGTVVTGPVEGTGNAYFGLPGAASTIVIDASVVVGGEVHLHATTHVAGPLVLAYGVTLSRRGTFRLVPEGRWGFQVERERVPGFVTRGGRRPGLLHSCAPDPAHSAEQGLYLASPAR